MRRRLVLAVASLVATAPAGAQSLAARVDAIRDGTVLMHFAARPGVCGNGHGSVWTRRSGYDYSNVGTWNCLAGPVEVSIGRADKQTVSVRTRVGGERGAVPPATDLGSVSAVEAAHYLIGLARSVAGTNASEAMSGAAFADADDLSADFLGVVRDGTAPLESRKQALFWLGQGDVSTSELVRLYDGLQPFELRQHYTFVLSQRHDDAALDKLIDVAQHDTDRDIRKQAMFWLGQSHEPKAIKFFQDVLRR